MSDVSFCTCIDEWMHFRKGSTIRWNKYGCCAVCLCVYQHHCFGICVPLCDHAYSAYKLSLFAAFCLIPWWATRCYCPSTATTDRSWLTFCSEIVWTLIPQVLHVDFQPWNIQHKIMLMSASSSSSEKFKAEHLSFPKENECQSTKMLIFSLFVRVLSTKKRATCLDSFDRNRWVHIKDEVNKIVIYQVKWFCVFLY